MEEKRYACSFFAKLIKDPLENTGLEGRRLLKWILINRMAGCDWINLARNRDKW